MTISITDKQHKNKVFLLVIGLLLLGFCLLTILPWVTGYGFELDQSWAIALHVAFANGLQFGKDLVYTYGPYGFLQIDIYYPDTYAELFALRLLIALAVWGGFFKLVRYCLARRHGAVFFLIPSLLFFPNIIVWMEYFQFTVVVLPLVLYFYVSKNLSPALVMTIAITALAGLTKHTYLLLGGFFIVLITIDEVIELRRIPQVAILYTVFGWLFWTLAGQKLTNFPAYLVNGLETIGGFSRAMGIAGNPNEVLLYILGTGLFLLLVGLVEWRSRCWRGMLPTLGLAAIFFITFKGAFTRHDSHALQAFFNIMPIISIFTAVLWGQIQQSSWRWGKKFKLTGTVFCSVCFLILLSMGHTIQNHYLNLELKGYTASAVKSIADRMIPAINLVTGNTDLETMVNLRKTQVQESNDLPSTSGGVDLYPNEIASIFAYDLPYQPRPVFQSFAAYTDKLARLNADHLTRPDAANSILFDLNPIDGHLASFEDGLSWPELLTRYDITNVEGRYLLLERSPQPRQYQLLPLDRQTIALGEWYQMPNNSEPVWTQLDLQPNLWGKLAAAALRLPDLYLEIETADGMRDEYRAVPDLLETGFLMSPVLSTRWNFLALATANWERRLAMQRVTKFRIIGRGLNSRLYPKNYEVSLSELRFPRQDLTKVLGWQDWNEQIEPLVIEGTLRKVPIDSKQFVWLAHAPTKTSIELKSDRQTLFFKFGILEEGVSRALQENAGDGVEFRITAEQNGKEKVLFARQLQPTSNPSDRGVQSAKIDLNQVDNEKLILETLPGTDNRWDWSYWSELKAE